MPAKVGDVVVSRFVSFDCQRQFKKLNGDSFASPHDPPAARFKKAKSLFGANAQFLPPDNARAPKILGASAASAGVLTTDFFGFDNTDDTYQLQGKGGVDTAAGKRRNRVQLRGLTRPLPGDVAEHLPRNVDLMWRHASSCDLFPRL